MDLMNIEQNRLQTFNNWPADAVVSSTRIAKAGFYSLNDHLKVKCFSCGIEISEWNYGDQVMARHRQLSPSCDFVINPSTSSNVPNISQQCSRVDNIAATPEPNLDSPQYSNSLMFEGVRLQSFIDWPIPHIITPECLARAGFYYLKQRDKTKCAFCNGIVESWQLGDDADKEHKRYFPDCAFVRTVINPRTPALPNLNNNLHLHNNLQELGVNEHRKPKKAEYATLESRLRTFVAWPVDLIQTPDGLGQAGFYYENSGDQVRCFHCDGGLRHWDPQDDPWTEHARWFPSCAYVLMVKGQDFVNACALDTGEEQFHKRAKPVQNRQVTDSEIQAHMFTPQVITALNIGLHVGRIKQAIREKLERTGVGFSCANAVIEAALNVQLEEEDNIDSRVSQEINEILTEAVQLTLNQNEEQVEQPSIPEPLPSTCSDSELKTNKSLTLEEENRLLKEARLCKICLDSEVGIVFLPCGHLATCVNCAPNLQDCPVCRCTIKATVRAFLS